MFMPGQVEEVTWDKCVSCHGLYILKKTVREKTNPALAIGKAVGINIYDIKQVVSASRISSSEQNLLLS